MHNFVHRFKSDESLMLAYQRGDSTAFEVLYKRHKDNLFAFIYHHYSNSSIVEEIAHDAWIAVIDAAGRYQAKAKFKTYLFSIAHKKLVDYWRKQKPIEELQEENIALDKAGPGQEVVALQMLQIFENLPMEQRQTFLLLEQGFSYDEIANITQVGAETVKSRIRYARKTLRNFLREEVRE